MFKQIVASALALFAAAAFAAVDVNKATLADLESVKGVGPTIAGKILDERKKGAFKDWNDMVDRVKGVGEGNAAKFSAEGLTVNGKAFTAAAPAAMKKDDKPAAKADDKKTPAAATAPIAAAPVAVAPAPATTTAAAAPAAKAEMKKDEKAMAKDAKDPKASK
jgi:competence protein ComEA